MKTLLVFCATAFLLLSAFIPKKKIKPKLPAEFVYIPAGTFIDLEPGEEDDGKRRVSMHSFYMSKYEVTNLQYRQFVEAVSPALTDDEKRKILWDSMGWKKEVSYCEPARTYYHRHPAYSNHPVVNITHEAAAKYCEWLQQKIQNDNPDLIIEVKVPARLQWVWAAMGGRSQAMFPWGNWYLRNRKGEFLCKFRIVGDQAIVRNRSTGQPEIHESYIATAQPDFYTVAVKSFYPNDFGLYNMCGNAAEMVGEKGVAVGGSWNDYGGDVHIRSQSVYELSAPTVGFRPIIIVEEKDK